MSLILDGTNGLSDVDGTAGTPAIRGSDANTGVFFGTDIVGVSTGGSERVRVDASGNVGIGTSSPQGKTESKTATVAPASAAYGQKAFVANIPYSTSNITSSLLSAYDGTIHGVDIGYAYNGTGYNLMLATNSTTSGSPTERARIDSSGNLLVGATAPVASERLNVTRGGSGLRVIHVENTRNVSGDETYRSVLGSNCNNTGSLHFVATILGTGDRLYMYGNGNIQNANGSYGTLSDAKLKENITDATPKLEKLNQVRVVNYNLKTDPNQRLLGVVAQELEQIFPGMVEETADKDAEGNDLGTTTKGVKISVFVPMLIKGLQELKAINDAQAQTIESLTARVVALEGQA